MEIDNSIFDGLRKQLSNEPFPRHYLFKFIFPKDLEETVKALFEPQETFILKPSENGKYISLTCNSWVNNMEEIIDVYKKAAGIKGVISL